MPAINYDVLQGQDNTAPSIDYSVLNQPAKQAGMADLGANADQSAQAIAAGKQVGMPPAAAVIDPAGTMAAAKQKTMVDAIDSSPAVSAYVAGQPVAAKVSNDDYQNLSEFELIAGGGNLPHGYSATGEAFDAFGSGFNTGLAEHQYSLLSAASVTGLVPEKTLADYEAQFASEVEPEGKAAQFTNWLGKQVGGLAGPFVSAGAGAAAGSVAGPGGAAVGGTAAMLTDIGVSTAGSVYRGLSFFRDNDGKPMTEAERISWAIASGTVGAAVGALSGGALSGAASKTISSLTTKLIAEDVVRNVVVQASGNIAKAGLTGAGINAGMQLGSQLMSEIGKTLSSDNVQTIFNDEKLREDLINQTVTAARDGALLFGTLHAIGYGLHPVTDALFKQQAETDRAKFEQTFNAAQVSKTRERSPEMFAEFASKVFDNQTVDISAERLAEVRAADPKAFDYVPDIDAKIASKQAESGDVSIPAADYFAYTKPEEHTQVKDHVRMLTGLTAEDAAKLGGTDSKPIGPLNGEVLGPEYKEIPPEQIARAVTIHDELMSDKKVLWLDPIFDGGKAVNMPEGNFARYSAKIQDLQRSIGKAVFDAVFKEHTRNNSAEFKDLATKATEKLRPKLNELRPDLKAVEMLTHPDAPKIDPESLDPTTRGINLPKDMFEKNGVSADALAELTGHRNGKEMLDAVAGLYAKKKGTWAQLRESELRNMAEDSVKQTHGEYGPERAMNDALESLMDVKQLDVLTEEMNILGKRQISREAVQSTVLDMHEKMNVKDGLAIDKITKAIGRFGQAAETALLKGDIVGAFKAKQSQVIQFELLRQAKQFQKEFQRGNKLLTRYAKNKTVTDVAQEYTDQVHQLFEKFNIQTAGRSAENVREATGGKSLQEFAHDVEDKGGLLYVHPVATEPSPPSLDKLNVAQLRGLMRTVTSLDHVGKFEGVLDRAIKNEQVKDVREEMIASMQAFRPDVIDNTSIIGKIKETGRRAVSALIRPERYFDWFDNRNPLGAFNRYVFSPLKAAEYKMLDTYKEFAGILGDIGKDKEFQTSVKRKLINDELLDPATGKPLKLKGESLISMMLNSGSKSNRAVLEGGYGWKADAVDRFIAKNATPKDWETVQKLWGMMEDKWADVQRVTKARTGVAIERIESRMVDTGDGKFIKGGYWPLMMDNTRGDFKISVNDGTLQMNKFFVSADGFKSRTGRVYPLELSLDQLPFKLRQLAHAIHFSEPMADASKIVMDKGVRGAIRQRFGAEYVRQMDNWFGYVARNGNTPDTTGVSFWDKMAVMSRHNMVTTLIGFKPDTAVIHGSAAMSNTIGEVGPAAFSRAMVTQFMKTDGKTGREIAHSESGELQNRGHNYDRDTGLMTDLAMGGGKFVLAQKAYAKFSMSMVSQLDYESAMVGYIAKKETLLSQGVSYPDAVYQAEKLVRNAHGSSGLTDLPAIMRSQNWKFFTMFYGYFNHSFNQLYNAGMRGGEAYSFFKHGDSAQAAKAFGDFANAMVYYLAIPAIVHEAVRGEKKEGESSAGFLAKAVLGQIGSTLPVVRDLSSYALTGRTPEASPISSVMKGIIDPMKDLNNWAHGDDVSEKWVKHLVELPGWSLGLGSKSIANAAQSGYDWKNGNLLEPDWNRFLLTLDAHPRKGK